MGKSETAIPCSRETYERVKDLKRGGEHFDDLLNKLADAYNPAEKPNS